jgi:hypothetical protein
MVKKHNSKKRVRRTRKVRRKLSGGTKELGNHIYLNLENPKSILNNDEQHKLYHNIVNNKTAMTKISNAVKDIESIISLYGGDYKGTNTKKQNGGSLGVGGSEFGLLLLLALIIRLITYDKYAGMKWGDDSRGRRHQP